MFVKRKERAADLKYNIYLIIFGDLSKFFGVYFCLINIRLVSRP